MKNQCPNINTPEWKRIIKSTDGDEKEALKIWNKEITLFDEALVTNDNSIYYTDESRVYLRTSEMMESMFTNTRLTLEQRADFIFDKNEVVGDKVSFRNKLTDTVEEYTREQLIKHLEKVQNVPRLRGKVIHSLLELEGKYTYEQAVQDLPELELNDYNYAFVVYNETKERGVFKNSTSDVVQREKVIAIDIDLKIENKILNGIAGTIDEYIEHDDGTVSTRDYKTGQLSSYAMGQILKKYGKNIDATSLNKAKLQQTIYALALKLRNPTLEFRKIELLKLPSENEETEMYYDVVDELRIYLPVVEAYFKENSTNFNIDSYFFNPLNYISSNTKLNKLIEVNLKKNDGMSLETVREKVQTELLQRLDKYRTKLGKLQAKPNPTDIDKANIQEHNAYIQELLYQIDELVNGYSTIKSGLYKKSVDAVSAIFADKDRATNPLAATFTKLYNTALVKLNSYLYLLRQEVPKINKPKTSNYKQEYNWFWEGGDMVTYNSSKWNTLTQEQKEYLDYFRWTQRFELFKTMNPKMGYDFILNELSTRTVWDGLEKEILENQLQQLDVYITREAGNTYSFNKFKGIFNYYEGWIHRVSKTQEEQNKEERKESRIKSYTLSDKELNKIEQAKTKSTLQEHGIQLDLNNEGAEGQLQDKYTYNPTVIFSKIIEIVAKKRYLDDVINVGDAINNFLVEEDKRNKTNTFSGVTKYVSNIINSAILKKNTINELPSFTATRKKINQVTNEEEEVEITVSLDKIARNTKTYFSFVLMAYQPLSALRRSISGTLNLGIHSITNSLAKMAGVKNVEFSVRDGATSWTKAWQYDAKTKLMTGMFGILPQSYEEVGYKDGILQRTDPLYFRKLKELGFSLDRVVDNANFIATMIAQLKAMKLPNGKSMWDSYEVINGKLTYTGDVRGVETLNGQVIKEIRGLTEKEINKLKAYSTKMYGAYRDEERSGLEISTIGSLFAQFKKFAVPIYTAAFATGYESESLGKYVETGETINGIKELKWQPRYEQGFVITVIQTIAKIYMAKGDVRGVLSKMNDSEKTNLALALTKVGLFAILGGIIGHIFGDSDDDDKNKIKQLFNQIKRETVTELNPYDTFNTLTSVPTIERLMEMLTGVNSLLIDSAIKGERIESGVFRNGYFGETVPPFKGIPQLMKNLPVTSTVWSIYRQGMDLESLLENM